ncbi:sugar ABC transporter substrate-binding protein [Peptoniphilaceae bacterium SGI.131]
MKKHFRVVIALCLVAIMVAGCGNKKDASNGDGKGSEKVVEILKEKMPEQMKDGKIKVAVVRNLAAGDHTQQFLDGCVSEGKALGFEVDTFVTDGDNAKAQETIAQVIQKDYDGLIVSHAEAGYCYDSLKPAVDKGMKVVTFDSVPYPGGDTTKPILEGVTSTAQEDPDLAKLSLDSLVEGNPDKKPVKVIRAWMGPDIPPLDKRQVIYDQYVKEGKIQEVELVGPVNASDARGGTQEALAAILPKYPEGKVDAIWGSYDELAKGCLQALNDAGRKDIKIFSIDVSNDDINLMLANKDVWRSTAAVDPKLIGIADMRILAAKFAGEKTPDTFNLPAQLVKTDVLNDKINMTNIQTVVEGWGLEKGIFDGYDWMKSIKSETSK